VNTDYDSSKPFDEKKNPTWIYADRNELQKWAQTEPTEFVGTIYPNADEALPEINS
jgi:hypothetical protein